MNQNISSKINLLTKNSKLLILGKLENLTFESLNNHFKVVEVFEKFNYSSEFINNTLYEQFDVVIFCFTKKEYENFIKSNLKLHYEALYIISDDLYLEFKTNINHIYSILINPSINDILNKIYPLISLKETTNILKTKEKVENKYKNDAVNIDIDTFLDQYSGSIMFINDDLNESLDRLKELELSKELFDKINKSLAQLSSIFKENKNLYNTSILLDQFTQVLDSIILLDVDPSNYDAFDYLTNIIEDLTLYIDELFVYRLFKDVSIFEDSMQNNINFFETKLTGIEENEDEDNLEFF